jgi:Lipase (class 3)
LDAELLANLARYAVYANAAYGSMMDVAFGGGFHLRDNLQNLLLRTRTPKGDVIAVQRDARRHPAYFLLRDRVRKRVVLCLRGTWTAHDVLNDLCCEADDLHEQDKSPSSSSYYYRRRGASRHVRVHHGMLLAAKAIQEELQPVLEAELEERPDYSLVLAGHSMGGGVAALLGILWEHKFPGVFVYAYGAPCVASVQENAKPIPVVSVLHELDPFSRMSLGHVADVSIGIGLMCDDVGLRSQVIERTSRPVDEMPLTDLKWCSETMARLRSTHLRGEKLYPPGRILLLERTPCRLASRENSPETALRDVQPEYFQDLLIRPRIFDLTRHAPASYIRWLRQHVDRSTRGCATHEPN